MYASSRGGKRGEMGKKGGNGRKEWSVCRLFFLKNFRFFFVTAHHLLPKQLTDTSSRQANVKQNCVLLVYTSH